VDFKDYGQRPVGGLVNTTRNFLIP